MGEREFSKSDHQQMQALGITEAQVRYQIEIFCRSSFFVCLHEPCTPANGVQRVSPETSSHYLKIHDKVVQQSRFQTFVPASGAATRMFQTLLQIYRLPQYLEYEELQRRAEHGVAIAADFLRFMENIERFAFFNDLEHAAAQDGLALNLLIQQRQFLTILDYLLTERGLNYGSLPKGLLKFHRYPAECRTAFEEHLAEAARYQGNGTTGRCRLHFTVSPEHERRFLRLMERVRGCYEERCETRYDVCFSSQKPWTNTIAVDMDNRVFRDRFGRLHFRPGGHGALLENLNDLQGDLVYIKNVDNLAHDRFKDEVVLWKKILGGYLAEIQEITHAQVRSLSAGVAHHAVQEAESFARQRLLMAFPVSYDMWPLEERHRFLLDRLNRPIRVCGVVENTGEPGGAPFWVRDKRGHLSLQIVEKAQVDLESPEQRAIWMSSTHFNPVDLVCALRDFEGKPFDLRRYADPEAVFISKKSRNGRDLKALELPGLWNGSMADWITVVVEVPRSTFNPVKTVCDLLKAEHQMDPC